jgi:hypothetical protein
MSIPTPDERPAGWWVPFAELSVAALWLVWVLAPPPVSSLGTWWFDLVLVPAGVACLFGVAVVAMWRRLAPRGALAWFGLATLGVILVLHAFMLWIVGTFPTDF